MELNLYSHVYMAEWLTGDVPAFHSRLECGSVRIPFLRLRNKFTPGSKLCYI